MAKALLRIRDSCGMRQASSLSLTKTRAANVPFLGTARIPVRSNDDRENFRGHCTCKQLLCTPLVSPPNGRYLYISTIKKQDRSIKIADRLVAVGYRSHTRSISDQSRSHFQGDVLDLDLEAFSFDDVPEKLGSKKTSVPAGDTAESARGERPDGKGTTSTVTETREREPIVPEDASHEKAPPQDPTENEESDWNDLTFSETDAPAEEYKAFEAEMRRAYGAGGTDNGDVSEDDQHDGEHEIWERVDWLPDRPDTELSDDIDELCYCYKKTVYHSHLLFVNGWDPRDQTSREVALEEIKELREFAELVDETFEHFCRSIPPVESKQTKYLFTLMWERVKLAKELAAFLREQETELASRGEYYSYKQQVASHMHIQERFLRSIYPADQQPKEYDDLEGYSGDWQNFVGRK